METFYSFVHYAMSFVVVISVIVFVHEFGHYWVARRCKVRIETFSIGFGKEIFGFNDRHGTRWKFSVLPLGGYVKMFGDTDPASGTDAKTLEGIPMEERKHAFHYKSLPQKAAIVSAGPLANFILSILILTFFFSVYGVPHSPPVVGEVVEDSAAKDAGLQKGDRFIELDGQVVESFGDIQSVVRLQPDVKMRAVIMRGDKRMELTLSPRLKETKDVFGNPVRVGQIGIMTSEIEYREVTPPEAFVESFKGIYQICVDTLKALGQIITGKRSVEELGGPIKIAKYSGQSAEKGVETVLWFIAMLSVNLGLVNLFPIPLLDGGHLMYYTIEALSGRPLAAKVQDYGMKAGFVFLVGIMLLTFINDIKSLKLF